MKPISGAILYKMFQFSLFELYFSWGIGILSLSTSLDQSWLLSLCEKISAFAGSLLFAEPTESLGATGSLTVLIIIIKEREQRRCIFGGNHATLYESN